MELALITVEKIIEMFVIMMIGAAIIKTHIGNHQTGKDLSAILLKIITPCMIIMSYQVDFDTELLVKLGIMAGVSILSFVLGIAIAHFAIPDHPDAAIEKMAIAYSNCGFIGIPLASAVLGDEGVLYITVYILVYNVFIWSHGILLMTGSTGNLKQTLKNLCQPSMIAILFSLVLFLLRIRLPEVLASPIDMIGDMNTPVAMLVSGINLASSDILGSLKRMSTYKVSALKLLVIPVLTVFLMRLLNPGEMIAMTVIIATACPSGAIGTMMALQYNKNSQYFSELFTITTVLSLCTIPLVVLVSGLVL